MILSRSFWESAVKVLVKSLRCPYMIFYTPLGRSCGVLFASSSKGPRIKILKILRVGACVSIFLGCSEDGLLLQLGDFVPSPATVPQVVLLLVSCTLTSYPPHFLESLAGVTFVLVGYHY